MPDESSIGNQPSFREEPGRHRFLLFGSLSSRKGIFLVLEAMHRLPDHISRKTELLLAGKIVKHQQEEFAIALANLRKDCPNLHINHLDAFIPYTEIPALFSSATTILAPYVGNESSSGVLGHAALHNKPVIGPDQGLIGKLIRTYDLGIALKQLDASSLTETVTRLVNQEIPSSSTDGMLQYVRERNPNVFVERMLSL